jgi:hypothetical protein
MPAKAEVLRMWEKFLRELALEKRRDKLDSRSLDEKWRLMAAQHMQDSQMRSP